MITDNTIAILDIGPSGKITKMTAATKRIQHMPCDIKLVSAVRSSVLEYCCRCITCSSFFFVFMIDLVAISPATC